MTIECIKDAMVIQRFLCENYGAAICWKWPFNWRGLSFGKKMEKGFLRFPKKNPFLIYPNQQKKERYSSFVNTYPNSRTEV